MYLYKYMFYLPRQNTFGKYESYPYHLLQLKVTLLVVNDYTVMCFFQVVRITITKLTVNVYILKPLILKFLRKYRLKVSINVIIDIYNTNFLNFLCFTDICQSLSSAVQRNSTFMENISLE